MKDTKYQVFISSTFVDLKEERQAAVEGILTSHNIPAGMELFTANNEDQWTIIKKWIEASDIYMLILGGRYGTVDNNTGKSYTQMEYEYAKEIGKPTFALVISPTALEKLKETEPSFIETAEPKKLDDFKSRVESQMVGYYDDVKDIQIATIKAINEIVDEYKPLGWVKADNTTSAQVAEELARLTKENNRLTALVDDNKINGLTVDGMQKLLISKYVGELDIIEEFKTCGQKFGQGHIDPRSGSKRYLKQPFQIYTELGLIYQEKSSPGKYKFTEEGHRFYLQLLVKELS